MSSLGPKRYDAFLSYNSQDRPAVHEVAARLKGERLELYLEEWELPPGREFQPALAEALCDSKACVVFLGPNGLGPWQKQELQVAIDRRARDEAFPVIPVLLPGAERPRRGDVAHLEFLINASWVEFLTTLDDEHAYQKLLWGITGQKPPTPEGGKYAGQCPYRGLQVFRPEDAKFFFGRDKLTDWLVSDLRREIRAPQGVRFLAVLGPSGCGKSSVVLAGLIPRVKAGAIIEGSDRWPVASLRPGDDPLKSLTEKVVPLLRKEVRPDPSLSESKEQKELLADLRTDGEESATELDRYIGLKFADEPEDRRLMIVVDQFEEVFTYRPEDDQARKRFEASRAAFFASLLNAVAAPAGRVAVVLTMRSDFLGACAPFPKLNDMLNAHLMQVGPMREDELREAIEKPAYLVGCEPEPALTERLLADVKGQPGALPLLQFALKELWEKRDVRKLRLDTYKKVGGIEGALEHRANEIFEKFEPEEQDLCRRIFLRLVQPGEGTGDTKCRVAYHELLPDDPARAEAVRRIIQRLADHEARLITTEGRGQFSQEGDGRDQESYVEVAHEALIRGWTQLRRWVDADRAGLRLRRQLTEAAREWKGHPSDASLLYQGTRLATAREWAEAHPQELNLWEREFLEASVQQERRRQLAIRLRRRAWLSLAILVALGISYWIARRKAHAKAHANEVLVALAAAEIREVPRLIDQLQAGDRYLVRDRLEAMVRPGSDDRLHLRAALILLPDDPTLANYLFKRLRWAKAEPYELLVIRQALHHHGHAPALTPKLQALLEETPAELTDSQLRAAGALALFEPNDPRWPALGPRVAAELVGELVRQDPLLIDAWREVFQAIAPALTPPLRRHFADRSQPEQRALAYTLLFAFATKTRADDPRRTKDLTELIDEADPAQFDQVLEKLQADRARAIDLLARKLDKLARFNDAKARCQGQIATALVRLKQADLVWPLLKHSDDPSVRTELIHDLKTFKVPSDVVIDQLNELIDQLKKETDQLKKEEKKSILQALVLAFGGYSVQQVSDADRKDLAEKLEEMYRTNEDPGVHGGIDWLLRRKWGQAAALDCIDGELASREPPQDRNWYVNGQGQTFAVVRGPVEFRMGSPEDEADRNLDEIPHRKRIARSFAIAAKEVTVAQYARFLEENPEVINYLDHPQFKKEIPIPDCAMGMVDWYNAARYCNWLSRREGIPEDQWYYPEKIGPGMTLPADHLERTGYRLPTEVEWEYACRAGSAAARPYGGSEALLSEYGWHLSNTRSQMHPVGGKKPNDLGLFDVLGNAWEWTLDPYGAYQPGRGYDQSVYELKHEELSDKVDRVLRGGSFGSAAPFLRSALRTGLRPSIHLTVDGLRPARTIRGKRA